ncbi:TPA: AlpA family transcriptional regulator [Citrobacter freundii]|jgi:prophage regulatory protein|uniref:AlpA family transcriptional regulator n=1 Tax=Citrobacter freundii TaxID=546 RepID=A0A9P3Z8F5_CITFR|nr:AlpA family transcriptional regulator [Citrobacter freundii]HAT3657618.1 AlpA family transcriptional regulator [Citrobacter freundii]HAT3739141.1 AlpA family transcriptional regulator [Citrobacter freundii]HBH7043335.1 AlpA family transcriptional regulator [Citrobacter freundii]HED2385704.1 AlpA family transcriptional regulator [Citrobacter freundii]
MSQSFIRLPEVQRRTGYSKAWIYRLISQQRFPSAVKIGSRAIAFIESEIDDWIDQRIEESRSSIYLPGIKSHAVNASLNCGNVGVKNA